MKTLLFIANILSIAVAFFCFLGYFFTKDFEWFEVAIGTIVINIWGNQK